MNEAELKQVRSMALFSELTDAQLDCIKAGEVIEAPAGTVIATEGQRNGFFHVILEGEVRVTRIYDRQEILMAVSKTGNHTGELPFLLDIPWSATVRVSKAA